MKAEIRTGFHAQLASAHVWGGGSVMNEIRAEPPRGSCTLAVQLSQCVVGFVGMRSAEE